MALLQQTRDAGCKGGMRVAARLKYWWSLWIVAVSVLPASAHALGETALVTAVHGRVIQLEAGQGGAPVEVFSRLKSGVVLSLETGARLKWVFLETGRQEVWIGPSRVELTTNEGKSDEIAASAVRLLPVAIVKQIAKMPRLDTSESEITYRVRAIATPDAISKLETDYDRLRTSAGGDDLNADMFLLSGLFDLREFQRVETVLADLELRHKNNTEVRVLIALYRKALHNVKKAR